MDKIVEEQYRQFRQNWEKTDPGRREAIANYIDAVAEGFQREREGMDRDENAQKTAEGMINAIRDYVDSLTDEQIREYYANYVTHAISSRIEPLIELAKISGNPVKVLRDAAKVARTGDRQPL